MTILDRVRERTGSDLSDGELQAMIDGIVAEIAARYGPAGVVTAMLGDPLDPDGTRLRTLRLARPIDSGQPVSVTEIAPGNSGDAQDARMLAPADYAVRHGGRTLQRLARGPNPAQFWAPAVQVQYTPAGDAAARDEATIKLVMLDLTYRGGLKSERAGDYQFTLGGDPAAEREAILASLEQRRGMVLA